MKKNIIYYSLSTAINKGAILLFFPFLTLLLTLEDFGKWSLVIIVSNLLIPIISLNGAAGILREGSNDLNIGFSLFQKYVYFTVAFGVISGFFAYLFIGENWFFYSTIIASAEAILMLGLTYLRAEEKALSYFIISFFKTLMLFLMILYAAKHSFSLETLLLYHFIIVAIFALGATLLLFVANNTNNLGYELIPILLFGIVLIPHGLSQWIMSSSDRLILEYMSGSTNVGIYSLAYNLAMVLMLLNSSIALALPPYMIKNYEQWKSHKYDKKIIQIYTYISILLFIIILSLYKIDLTYFHILGYYGKEMIPLISIIYLSIYLLGLYYFYANYLFYHKKAGVISKTTFYAASINVILTIVFVYLLGVLGAAFATLLAYILYVYKIRVETLKYEPLLHMQLGKNISLFILFFSIISLGFYYAK